MLIVVKALVSELAKFKEKLNSLYYAYMAESSIPSPTSRGRDNTDSTAGQQDDKQFAMSSDSFMTVIYSNMLNYIFDHLFFCISYIYINV